MSVNEETSFFALGQGCPVHGDEYMRECTMCGAEFCRICYPKSAVCPDCAEQANEDDDEEDDDDIADFDDVSNLKEVLNDNYEDVKEDEDDESYEEEEEED